MSGSVAMVGATLIASLVGGKTAAEFRGTVLAQKGTSGNICSVRTGANFEMEVFS